MSSDDEKVTATEPSGSGPKKKRPPKEVIERMNRIIIAAAETGKTPSELADEVYRRMFDGDE